MSDDLGNVPLGEPVVATPEPATSAPPPDPAHHINKIIYNPSIFWMLIAFPTFLIISLVLNGIYIHRFITMTKDNYYSTSSAHFVSLLILIIVSVFWILVPGMNIILSGVMAGMVARDWKKYSQRKGTSKSK